MLCFRPSIENINGAQWQIREQLWCDLALLNDNKVRNEKLLNEHELHDEELDIFNSPPFKPNSYRLTSQSNETKPQTYSVGIALFLHLHCLRFRPRYSIHCSFVNIFNFHKPNNILKLKCKKVYRRQWHDIPIASYIRYWKREGKWNTFELCAEEFSNPKRHFNKIVFFITQRNVWVGEIFSRKWRWYLKS